MMKLISIFKKLSLTLAIILAATTSIFASHGMGADLTYDYVSANTYKVRLKFFRDCHGILPGNTNTINIRSASGGFNSNYTLNQVGGALDITPLCSSQQSLCTNSSSPNDGVQQYTYEATITLATPRPDYIISFSLCCRNGAITTLNNPGGQNIYVEAVLNSQVANSSPDFNNAPVPFVCNGQLVNYNHGVTDIDGDELVFSLAPCLQGAGTSVTYNAGFSGTNPLSTVSPFSINTSTGALSFTPNAVQVGVIGIKVSEYRLVGGIRTKIGEVLRDMQITVDNCDPASGGGGVTINSAPIVSGINGTAGAGGTTGSYVLNATAGTPISFNLAAYDDFTTNLNLTWNGGGLSGATFTPNGTGTAASFSWTPTINDGGNKFFTVSIKDDNCPLLGISVYTFTIQVAVPVSITCPSNQSATTATGTCSKAVSYISTATGTPAPIVTYNFSGATTGSGNGDGSGSLFNKGVTTVTLTATDGGGNTATCQFTVTVTDAQAPSITCPANISVGNSTGTCGGAVVTYTAPIGTDNCPSATTTQIAGLASGATFPMGVTTNTFRVIDAVGNSTTCSFTVTVTDTEAPSISCPANISVNNAAGTCGAVVNYTAPIGTDNCASVTTTQVAGLASGATFPVGVTTNTFRATDAAGNSTTCSFTVTVVDVQPPSITCPANISVGNTPGTCGAIVTYTAPIGTDNCPSATTARVAGLPSGATFPIGVTTIAYRVTDAAGNFSTCSFTVTVDDTQVPVLFNCPANISVNNAPGICGAVVFYTLPTASDNCPLAAPPTLTAGLPSGATFPVGVTTVTYRVTDAAGNSSTCSFTVTVADTEAPSITCPANISVSNAAGTCGAVVTYTAPIGTDNCPSATTTQIAGLASGATFPVGITTNTFRVTDGVGNTTTCSFTVTVVDTEEPSITCPANISISNAAGTCGAVATYTAPIGTDNCSSATTTQIAGLASGATFPVGITTNTFRVTDAAGNSTTCSFTVTVTDTEAPSISCPANISVGNDAGVCGAVVSFTAPIGTDNCPSATTTQIAGLASGATFPIGITTNTFKVTDAAGNSTTCSFTVTVTDTEAPSITCPGNISVSNGSGICGAVVNYTAPIGTDNCPSATTTQIAGLASGATFPVGITTNTFLVTDAAGNTATCSFTVTVNDTQAPVITCPTTVVVTANNDGSCTATGVTLGTATATDNCGGVIGITNDAPTAFPQGNTNVTWTATDAAGNTSTCVQIVTVNPYIANVVQPTSQTVCTAASTTAVIFTSTPAVAGVIYTWTNNNTSIGLASSGTGNIPSFTATNTTNAPLIATIVVTASTSCAGSVSISKTFTITVNPVPVVNAITNQGPLCNNTSTAPVNFTTTNTGAGTVTYTWVNNTPSIGLAASGSGNIPSFTLNNTSVSSALTATITVTPHYTLNAVTCDGAPKQFTITVRPASNGTISGASNTQTCAGEGASINVILNGTLNFTSTFRIREIISSSPLVFGTSTTSAPVVSFINGAQAISIPGSSLPNTSSVSKTYRIDFNSLQDGNGCTAVPQLGSVDITVNPLPVISVSAAPTSDVCPGTNVSFNVTETNSIVGSNFKWVAKDANNVTLGSGNNISFGPGAVNTNLGLTCTSVYRNPITFTFTPVGPSTLFCNGVPATRVVNIRDLVAPTANPLSPINVECYSAIPAANINVVTGVTDNCDAAPVVTLLTNIPAAPTCNGGPITVTRVYRITDCSGNSSTVTQTINVADVTAPTANTPAAINVECYSAIPAANINVVTGVTDNCDAAPVVTLLTNIPAAPTCNGGPITVTRVYRITDCSGNSSTVTQTINVADVTAPTANTPASISVQCYSAIPAANINVVTGVTDNCDAAPVVTLLTNIPAAPTCNGGPITVTRVYRITDCSGNSSTVTQTINVADVTAPTANTPAAINVECYSAIPAANINVVTGVTDNCDAAPVVTLLTNIPAAPTCNGGPITVTRVYRITDCSGNSSTVTQTINVADVTAPTANTPASISVQCYSAIPAANINVVTGVTDNCDAAPVVTLLTNIPAAPTCNGGPITVTRVYRITDCSGNSSTVTQTINVADVTAPTANTPASISVQCYSAIPAANINVVTGVTDNCDAAPVVTLLTNIPAAPTCNGGPITVTRVYRITDCSGNSSTVTQTINVADVTAPTANTPASISVQCYSAIPAANINVVTGVTDNCDAAPVVTLLTNIPAAPTCNGGPITVTRVYRITDCSGNSSTVTQTINVADVTAPTANTPASISVQCYSAIPAANINVVTGVTDNCDAAPVVTLLTNIPAAPTCNGGPITVTRVYRITDCSGNSSTVTQTINVADVTAPTANTPAAINVECYSAIPAANINVVTGVTDNCDAAPVVTLLTNIPAAPTCNGGPITVTRVYRITDCSGNSSTVTQTINVADVTAPTANTPASISVQCYSAIPAANINVVTGVTDNCDAAPVVTLLTNIPAAPTCNGGPITVTRVYRITDCSGNSSTVTQTINVADVTAPTANTPAAINVECYSAIPAANINVVTGVTDNCDAAPVVTLLTNIPAAPTCNGGPITVTRVYRITDCSGNSSTVTQTINVADVTAPTANTPASISVQCYSAIPAANINVVTGVTDNCDAAPVVTLLTNIPAAPTCNGGPITVTRVYRITDCSGNSSTVTQTINVADVTAPTANTPASISVQCYSAIPAANINVVTGVTDNCDAAPVVTLLTNIPAAPTCNGGPITVTRVYRITDCSGNSSTVTQTINVADVTAPTANTPAAINVECYSAIPAANINVVTGVTDNCDAAPVVTLLTNIPAAPTCNGGPITVTRVYRITDCSGNSSTVTQTINVADVTAPTANTPAAINVECYSAIPAANINVVTGVTDNCDAAPVVTLLTNIPAAPTCNGGPITVTRVYRITDCSGNSSTVTQTINVADVTAPTANTPASISVQCYSAIPAANINVVTGVTDNCDAAPVVTLLTNIPAAPTCNGGPITVTRVYRITDCSGNSSTVTQTINVADVTAPTANTPASINVECYSAIPAANINVVTGVTDNCDAAPVVTLLTNIPAAPTCNGGPITVTRVYRITDCSGNSSTVTQTINVADVTAPIITSIPANVTVGCANLVPAVNTLAVVASDNCNSTLTITANDVITPGSCANRYSIARTYTVTDCSGNSTSSTQTITVNDITGPVLIAPATQTLNVGAGAGCSVPMPDYISLVSATASDACGAGVITYQQLAPNAPGSLVIGYGGTRTIVIVATDACGNTSTTSFLLNLVDQTAPTAICKSITVNLSSTTGGGTVSITPTMVNNGSTDNCSAVTLVSVVPSTFTCANVGANTVTLTVRDDSGNTSTCTSTVTVNDITAPSITCNAPIITTTGAGNTQCGAVVTFAAPVVTDNCSGATTVQTTGLASGSLFPVGVTTNTFVATDASGNTASCSFTVTVTDNTAPMIVCNAPIVTTTGAGNTQCGRIVTYTAPVGTDNCSGATTVQTAGLASGSLFPLGITTNTFVTTDAAGNTATCSFTVTVTDNTAPIAICKSITVNLSATPGAGSVSITPAMVNNGSFDNCSPVTLVSVVPSTFNCANVGPNTVTLTVSDAAGNTSTCTSIVTVKDITAPVVTCFGDTTIFKGNICTNTLTDLTGRVNATDNCSIVSVTQSVPVGTVIGASIANLPITLTVTDASGNTSSCTFNVHFIDNTPAVISGCPANITVNTSVGNTACGQVATWVAPTASDNCNDLGLPTLVSTHHSGDVFPVGNTTVIYTATDAAGNTSTCSFVVTVVDNTSPIIAGCPSTVNINTGAGNTACSQTATWTAPTASDNCSIQSFTSTHLPGATFPVGTTVVTYTATDIHGNSSTCSFNVIVTDNTAPLLTCNAPITTTTGAGNTQCGQVVTYTAPVGTDNCSGATTVQTAGLPSGSLFPVGVTTNTFVTTDAAGNSATCSFTVTVTDNTAPLLTCNAPITTTTGAGNTQCGTIVAYTAPVGTDNCSGVTTAQTAGLPSGSLFPVGVTTNTFVTTDAAGNTATCSFTVTVTDNTAPLLTCNAPITTTTGAGNTQCGKVVTYTAPVGTDNCSGATTAQTSGLPSGSLFPVGVTTNTFVTTDAAGNTATCSFTVTVTDNTAPLLTCNAPITTTTGAGNTQCGAVVTYTAPVGTDNCSGATTVQTAGLPSGSLFPVGVTTNTFVTTDAAGNTATCSFTVTVTDNTAPLLTCNAPITTTTGAGNTQCGAVVTYTAPVGTDNCSGATTVQTAGLPSGSLFPVGVTTNTFVTTDGAGNTATCSFTVTVTDNTAPLLTCNAPIITTTGVGNTQCGKVVTYTAPVGTDNCSGATTAQTAGLPSGSLFPVGVTTNTFVTTDAAGNTATCSFTVTVTDNTAPLLTCNAPITTTTGAGNTQCGKVVTYTAPVGTDNCSVATTAQTAGLPSGSLFPVGVTTNTFVTTDGAGNTATCSFTVTVTDNTAPVFVSCPSPITGVNPNGTGCLYTVATIDPITIDNCTTNPTYTWTMSGSGAVAPLSGTGSIGTHSFAVGTTTVLITATDAAGNTSTCSYLVNVVNSLSGTITGNANVLQNASSTSTITFTGAGGVKPYTFTYKVNGGANQTVSTTGSNNIVTVPQSNAVLGSFAYTLVSVTDANGCTGTLPQTTPVATVNVVSTLPDFSPIVNIDATQFAATGSNRDFIVNVSELGNSANIGAVVFRVTQPASLDITFTATSGSSNVFGGTANNNSDWTIVKTGSIITCTLKNTASISAFGNSVIGFKATRKASVAANQTGSISASIVNGSGGDNVNSNNGSSIVTSAQ